MLRIIINNYLLLVLTIGFILLLTNHLRIDKKRYEKFKMLVLVMLTLAISNIIEEYFGSLETLHFARYIFSFTNYSLRPLVVALFISLLTNNKIIKYLYYLVGVNALIYSTCFYTNIAFSFTDSNHFLRGPLCYSTHILCIFFLVVFLALIIKKVINRDYKDIRILVFVSLAVCISAYLDFTSEYSSVFDSTMLVSILIYYLYLYMEYNKKDIMTNLYNRSSFYFDIDDFNSKITSVVALDMNNLKKINDTYGHNAGDKTIKTIASILQKNENDTARFYRVGGDEFVALCFNKRDSEVKKLVDNIKSDLSGTNYSCSIGCEMRKKNEDIYELYKKADKKMYQDKERYHKKMKDR